MNNLSQEQTDILKQYQKQMDKCKAMAEKLKHAMDQDLKGQLLYVTVLPLMLVLARELLPLSELIDKSITIVLKTQDPNSKN